MADETPDQQTDEALDATFIIPYQGRKLAIDILDFTGEDEADFYEKTGCELTGLLAGDLRLRTVAGLVWIHLRRRDADTAFEDVNRQFSLRDLTGVETPDEKSDEGEPGPEG